MITSRNIMLGVFIYISAFLVFLAGANAQENKSAPSAAAKSPANSATAVTATPIPATITPVPTFPSAPSASAPSAPSASAPSAPSASAPSAPSATPTPKKPKRFTKMFAKFDTSLGSFKALLFHTQVPKTVENFAALVEGTKDWKDPKNQSLVKQPFYDGLTFHRIIKGFVIQGGDPLGLDPRRAGTGGPGFDLGNGEFHADLRFNKAGLLAMAKGATVSGSQFFVTLDSLPRLDEPKPTYPIFGEVVDGMDVVMKIGAVATDRRNDRPLEAVVIKKVTIIRQ